MVLEYIYYFMVGCTLSSYAGAIGGLEFISKKELVDFVSQNIDPCDYYTEIDDPTRNVDYGNGYRCDNGLAVGWYRFVGSGGDVIPNYCVEWQHCNTVGGLWMSGDLPELGEGEVTRKANNAHLGCPNTSGLSTSIKVKKCDGGYYVYYLTPPSGCYFSYCTDFEKNLLPTTPPVPKSSLECTENKIELAIEVPSMSVVTPYAYFDDQSCVDTFNGSHIIMTTELNRCGTKIKFPSSTEVTYYNNVWYMDLESDGFGEVKIQVECTYSRDKTLSVSSFAPNYNSHETSVQGFGDITFSMSMYKAEDFAESYAAGDYPIQVDVGQTLYVGLSAQSSTPNLELLIAECKASTSANPLDGSNSVLNYPLIQTGCPVKSTIVYIASNSTFSKRFSFEAFVFLDRSPEVFLHCEAVLCSITDQDSCDLDCSDQTRKRRSTSHIDKAERNFITIGPIHWSHRIDLEEFRR